MAKELLYGAAYYAEYMPYDRVEKDFDMMQAAGMNVVRIAESTWSTEEPEDGVFDFSYVDRVLDEAEKRGMYVIIGTPTYAIPSWLQKKDPSVMVTTEKGQALYGARQIMDIMNPTYRYHAERIIRRLVEHVAQRPCVIGFQVDNETKHYGTASAHVQQLFAEHLKQKFGTVEALNQAYGLAYWSNSIHSWEELPDVRGTINGSLGGEFAAFQRSLAAEFLAWQAQIVREYKREDQFITHNFDFEWRNSEANGCREMYSYGVQPDINHYEASGALTIAGTDIYHPSQDDLTGLEIAFGGDEIRTLKHDNYYVLETEAQAFKGWTPYPGQLRLQAYSHLAGGADGVLYWNWHSIHNSFETYWKGVLSHDLDVNPVYEEAARVAGEWKRTGSSLLHLKKKNRIALVTDTRSLTALKWFPIDEKLTYNDVVHWMYSTLYRMNLECDVVDVQALNPEDYRMIVTPALYCVSEEKLLQLREFVRGGGVLISSFKSFYCNEDVKVYADKQPHLLHECFGASYNQIVYPGKTTVAGKPVTCFMELLKPEGAEVLEQYEHKYWGAYAAVTEHSFGDGKAYYIGCYTDEEILGQVYEKAACQAGIALPPAELRWPLIIRSGENQSGKQLHYVMNYSEDARQIECPYEEATDLLTGTVYRRGESIELPDWDLAILEERGQE